MTTKRAFRQEAAEKKRLTRAELESAARYGVTTSPSMTDKALAEAIAEKLSPGAYKFAAYADDTYALAACGHALAAADEAASEAAAAADANAAAARASMPLAASSSAAPKAALNGTGAIHADAARDRMIWLSGQ